MYKLVFASSIRFSGLLCVYVSWSHMEYLTNSQVATIAACTTIWIYLSSRGIVSNKGLMYVWYGRWRLWIIIVFSELSPRRQCLPPLTIYLSPPNNPVHFGIKSSPLDVALAGGQSCLKVPLAPESSQEIEQLGCLLDLSMRKLLHN